MINLCGLNCVVISWGFSMGMFWSVYWDKLRNNALNDDFRWPSYGHFMGIVTGVNGDVMGLLGSCGDLVVIFYAVFLLVLFG